MTLTILYRICKDGQKNKNDSQKTQSEWENEMAVKVIDFTRQELYLDLRFFHLALSSLIPKAGDSLHTLATDGIYLYYSSEQILRVFQNNPKFFEGCMPIEAMAKRGADTLRFWPDETCRAF